MIPDAKLDEWQEICNDIPNHILVQIGIHKEFYIDVALIEAIVEIRRLKADHAEMVKRNALLRDRLDLPIERTKAYDAIMEEIKHLRSLIPQWQPMETAPKDGTWFLGLINGLPRPMMWMPGNNNFCDETMLYRPTKWMPIPSD